MTDRALQKIGTSADELLAEGIVVPKFKTTVGVGNKRISVAGSQRAAARWEEIKGGVKAYTGGSKAGELTRKLFTSARYGERTLKQEILSGGQNSYTAALALAMVSLAGIPPLAGFFGKFLLFRAALEAGAADPAFYGLVGVAVVGVVISLYYYLGIVRMIYWPRERPERSLGALEVSTSMRWVLGVCVAGMLVLGLAPGVLVDACQVVAAVLVP